MPSFSEWKQLGDAIYSAIIKHNNAFVSEIAPVHADRNIHNFSYLITSFSTIQWLSEEPKALSDISVESRAVIISPKYPSWLIIDPSSLTSLPDGQ